MTAVPGEAGGPARAAAVLGALALAAGGASLLLALAGDAGFAEAGPGPRVLNLHHANGLGALVLLAAGALALASGAARRPVLAVVAGALLLGGALAVAVGQGAGVNVLGATASTAAAFLGLGGGLLACGLAPGWPR